MSQPKNLHAREVAETPDVFAENNVLKETQGVLEQEYAIKEVASHDVKETVEEIAQILSVVEKNFLEIATVTDKNFETVKVTEDDLQETVTTREKDIQFFKADKNISGSPSGSENKTMKSLEKAEIRKNVCREFGNKDVCGKVPETGIVKKAINTPFTYNVSPSRKDCENFKEINDLLIGDSNQISVKEIVEKMNLSNLNCHYTEYRKININNLSKLYDCRNIMNKYLEENSCIVQQCRFVFTDTDATPDNSSISEQELETMNRFLIKKGRDHIECLRSLCWNLDGIRSKIHQYKKLNATLDMKTDNFLNFVFTDGKKTKL